MAWESVMGIVRGVPCSDSVRICSPFLGECTPRAVLTVEVDLSGHIHPLSSSSPDQQPYTSIYQLAGWSGAPGLLLNKPIWHEDWIHVFGLISTMLEPPELAD